MTWRVALVHVVPLLAACPGSSRPAVAPALDRPSDLPPRSCDPTTHDQVLLATGLAPDPLQLQILDVATGELAVVDTFDRNDLWSATWAGRCVVYSHGVGDEATLAVLDPATDQRWTLADGRASTSLAATDTGPRVAWDCEDDRGAEALCVAVVDGRGDVDVLATGPSLTALGWKGDEVIYQQREAIRAIAADGGVPRELASIDTELVQVARGGGALGHGDGEHFAIRDLDGVATAAIEIFGEAFPGVCDFAGADHVVCMHDDGDEQTLRLHAWRAGGSIELARSDALFHVLGAPDGTGALFSTEGDDSLELFLVRAGEAPRLLAAVDVDSVAGWRP